MNKTDKISILIQRLDTHYPYGNKCYLNHETPWQLLFATMLSAQCTDDRVNIVTKDLFAKYPTLEDFCQTTVEELEQDVKSTGFYHNKAKNIFATANILQENFDGVMPSDIETLTSFPGVGRKTANVVRGHIFNLPSLVVDTHVKRISFKLGLTTETDPVKVEFALMKIIPESYWVQYNTKVIAHGRAICTARSPKCEFCFLTDICDNYINLTNNLN